MKGRILSLKEIYTNNHYLVQVLIFSLVAIVGFYPGSYAILSGERPNPHISIHLHAFIMVLWIALIITQVSLKNMGLIHVHKILGLASVVLAPLMLISLCYVSFHGLLAGVGSAAMGVISNILLLQLYSIALFTIFFIWGFHSRLRDVETHKRAMIMTILVLLHAAIGRMPWLPFYSVPDSVAAVHLYNLVLIFPSLVYDKLTIGRLHSAHIIGMSAFILCILFTEVAWGASWWVSFVYGLLGHA